MNFFAHGQALTPVAIPLEFVTSEQLIWQSTWVGSQKKVAIQAQASEFSVLAAPVDAASTVQSILHLTSSSDHLASPMQVQVILFS